MKLKSKEELMAVKAAHGREKGGRAPRRAQEAVCPVEQLGHEPARGLGPQQEVETEIGGGVWRLVGREGVYDFEEYEDTAVSEQLLEHGFDHEAASASRPLAGERRAAGFGVFPSPCQERSGCKRARDQLGRIPELGSADRWHLCQQLFQGQAFGQVAFGRVVVAFWARKAAAKPAAGSGAVAAKAKPNKFTRRYAKGCRCSGLKAKSSC